MTVSLGALCVFLAVILAVVGWALAAQRHQVQCRHPAEAIRMVYGDARAAAGDGWRWCTRCKAELPHGDILGDIVARDARGHPVVYCHDGSFAMMIVASGETIDLRATGLPGMEDDIVAIHLPAEQLRLAVDRAIYENAIGTPR